MEESIVKRFMSLFQGYTKAHGQYSVKRTEADGKKAGRAITISEGPTQVHFESHLNGKDYILGIIMLRDDNSCSFGAIDVDIRGDVKLNETLDDLEKKIEKLHWCCVVPKVAVHICIYFATLRLPLSTWLPS